MSTLSLRGFDEDAPSDILRSLPQFHFLTSIKIEGGISVHTLQMLSLSKSRLRTLDICPVCPDGWNHDVTGEFGDGFSSVSSLRFRGNISDIAPLLHTIPLPSLDKLYVAPKKLYSLEILRDAAIDMSSTIAQQILRNVRLTLGLNVREVHLREIYEPLSTFKHLITLSVTLTDARHRNPSINISDADLSSAINAWPHLEEFEVSEELDGDAHRRGDPSVAPTISGLVSVARGWCALKVLGLPWFNTAGSTLPTMIANGAISGASHPLCKLRLKRLIGGATQWSIMELALTLDALFPRLGVIGSEQMDRDVAQWRRELQDLDGKDSDSMSDIILMFVAAARSGRTGDFDSI